MEEKEIYEYKELAESYLEYDFADHIEQIKLTVKDGWVDPLKAFLILKQIEELAKSAKEDILDNAVKEASQYEKGKEIDGYKLERINTDGRWDFSKIREWNDKKTELKSIENKFKAVFQNYQKGVSSFDEETGEQLPVPVYVNGKETIKVSKLK